MEIFNGLSNYDIGHLIYDLWLLIEVLFWVTLISYFIVKYNVRKSEHLWVTKAYLQLSLLVASVLILISVTSIFLKLSLVGAVLFGFYIFDKNRRVLLWAAISLLLGFGYTILPIALTLSYALIQLFIKRGKLEAI